MLQSISNEQINGLIDRYSAKGGMIYTIEGTLNDNYIFTGAGLKTVIIRECYLNEWSSCNVIKRYNKCPKKYERVIELLDNGEIENAERLFNR